MKSFREWKDTVEKMASKEGLIDGSDALQDMIGDGEKEREGRLTITRSRGGEAERKVHINDIKVPDLWHVAMAVRKGFTYRKGIREELSDEILDTWLLAHDFVRAIKEDV